MKGYKRFSGIISGILSTVIVFAGMPGYAEAASGYINASASDSANTIIPVEEESITALGTNGEGITLANSDFEVDPSSTDSFGWTLTTEGAWPASVSNEYMTGIDGNTKTDKYLYKWTDSAYSLSISQILTEVPEGCYEFSVEAGGTYAADAFTISVYTSQSGADDSYTVLTSQVFPGGTGWGKWAKVTTPSFEISDTNNEYVKFEISGSLSGSGDQDIHLDNAAVTAAEEPEPVIISSDLDGLKTLLDKAKRRITNNAVKHYYAEDSTWTALTSAVTDTETFITEAESSSKTENEINSMYTILYEAYWGVTPAAIESRYLGVESLPLDEDFITGADISSWYALNESDTVFKDAGGNALTEQGFFDLLAEGGTNYIRIRIWNDPYNAEGKGYGGGNNDLSKAITMGQLATNAGMNVLIDFHYSDFWADPGKQQTPKAWRSLTLSEKESAVQTYTYESLKTLIEAGVDVGMVQVGNETTQGIAGETGWQNMCAIFNAGSAGIRQIASEKDRDIKVVLHFTNPEAAGRYANISSQLNTYNVDYDVFATSYYPYWHGTIDNLKSVLGAIAETYNKEVMVAETSWATTLEDGDGHENTVRVGSNDTSQPYDFTLSGQATELRTVAQAISQTSGGIGMFYWEPAWISPNYVYSDGEVNEDLLTANKTAWETYGSGWASSYAGEYDPDDAGRWFGGSAIDNQAWFDFEGNAIDTINVYKYLRTGAIFTAPPAISSITTNLQIEGDPGLDIDYESIAGDVAVSYNDNNTRDTDISIIWNPEDVNAVNTNKIGTYAVSGVMTASYSYEFYGETVNAQKEFDVTLTVSIKHPDPANKISAPGFESGTSVWTTNSPIAITGDDPHSGSKSAHFWSNEVISGATLSQTVEALHAGTYTAGIYIQGGDAAEGDKQKLNIYVYDSAGTLKNTYCSEATLSGWCVWQNPEITDIEVEEGDQLTFEVEINSSVGGAWGTIDDAYMYGNYAVNVQDGANGTLVSDTTGAQMGEIVVLTATPADNYRLTAINLTGEAIENGTLSVPFSTTSQTTYSFEMPDSQVTAEAVFEAVSTTPDPTPTPTPTPDPTPDPTPTPTPSTPATSTISYVQDDDGATGELTAIISGSDSYTYTGSAIKPTVSVFNGKKLLNPGTDYTISYKDNVKVGNEARVIIVGKGTYTGNKTLYFTIAPKNISDADVAVGGLSTVQTSSVNPVVAYNGMTLGKSDYSIASTQNEITITGKGNYTGTRTETIKRVEKSALDTIKVKLIAKEHIYNGSAQTLAIDELLIYSSKTGAALDPSMYTVSYGNNLNAGKAMVKIVATGENLTGSISKTFKISPAKNLPMKIEFAANEFSYTGSAIKPDPIVTCSLGTLIKGTDYKISYKKNTKPGTAGYTVSFKGNYAGTSSINGTFKITPQSLSGAQVVTPGTLCMTNNAKFSSISSLAAPTVLLDGKPVTSSNYKVTYYLGSTLLKKTTKIGFAEGETSKTLTVSISPKGTNYTLPEGETLTSDIRLVPATGINVSKGKIKVVKVGGTKAASIAYTGRSITFDTSDSSRQGDLRMTIGKKILSADEIAKHFDAVYINNLSKGKATIILTAKDGDTTYSGSARGTFTIGKTTLSGLFN